MTYEYIDFNLSDDAHDVIIDVNNINNDDAMLPLEYNDCSIDDKICFIPIDNRSNILSILDHIGGFIDELFIMNILPYLSLVDTIHLSMTCKTFHQLSQSTYVWNILYRHDFIISEQRSSLQITVSERITTHEVHDKQQTAIFTKDMYRQRYIEIHDRLNLFEEGLEESRMMLYRFQKQQSIEIILEYTQIRIMLPLLFAVTFITAILLSLKLEGEGSDISYWSCLLLVILYLTYIMISMLFTMFLHSKQFDLTSIFFGMWINFKSPLSYIFEELLLNDMKKGYCLVVSIFLVIIQVISVAMKLSSTDSDDNKNTFMDLPWAIELIPTWILILGYLLLPILFGTTRTWLNGLLIVLLPCLFFFISISFNLNGSQLRLNHRHMSLTIVFIPFWIIEIFILVMSFLYLRGGVLSYNNQSLTGVQLVEHFILLIVVWGIILPIIITQALLSYRDDVIYNIIIQHSKNITIPSIFTCMIPVLVMSGCLFLIFTIFSLLLRTSYQVAREATMMNA